MKQLDGNGIKLLRYLIDKLESAEAGKPETYVTYKQVHDDLGLPLNGPTYGESLKQQGLSNLADWTESESKPGITGLIIDGGKHMPGEGYFRLFNKDSEDFKWWEEQIIKSKRFEWSPYIDTYEDTNTPMSVDTETNPPERVESRTYRILRDTAIARRVKYLHKYECQICRNTITLYNGVRYAEAHHIKPLGLPHNGPDVIDNIICLCPNHHAELDYGVRKLVLDDFIKNDQHNISEEYVQYHNEEIYKKP